MKILSPLHNMIIKNPKMILHLKKKINLLLLNKIALKLHSYNLEFLNTFHDIQVVSQYIFRTLLHDEDNGIDNNELIHIFSDSEVHDKILKCKDLLQVAAQSHLISAYYLSKIPTSESTKQHISEYLKKANALYSVNKLSDKSYASLFNSVTSKYQNSLLELKKVRTEIRSKLHYEIISPLKIDGQHLITFLSVFTSVYLCLSYLYFSNYLGAFGIRPSDYFYISDYFSTSLDSLVGVIVSVLFSFIALIYGATNKVNMTIDEIDTGKKSSSLIDHIFWLLLFFTSLASILYYFFTEGIPNALLSINIVMLILFLITKIPIEKYFSNHLAIRAFSFVIVISVFYVYEKSNKAVRNVFNNNGTGSISVEFDGINLSEHELRHLVNTTDYSMYWCYTHNESIIVSKAKLRSIRIPKG